MKWKIAVLSLLALPLVLSAEQQMPASAMIRYDADSTTLTYCRTEGWDKNVFTGPLPGPKRIKTTAGPTATVTSVTALDHALAPVDVRDILFIRPMFTMTEPFAAGYAAVVLTNADDDTVTVDPTVNWDAGFAYSYYKTVCGTTANDGWVDVAGATRANITIQYDQGDLDNLSWRFECRQATPGSVAVVVYPSEGDDCGIAGTLASGFCDFATAGPTANLTWEEFGTWGSCRIGFKVKTTDTSDAGANLERVTGSIVVAKDE